MPFVKLSSSGDIMTRHYDWTTPDKEGRLLRRGIDHAAELMLNSHNAHEVAQLLNSISAASKAKRDIADQKEMEDIRKQVEELRAIVAMKRVEIQR